MYENIPDFEPEGFSNEIFKNRYAFTEEESWKEACMRVATQMALAEQPEKVEKYKKRFYDVIVKNLFVPGGRILYGSGRPNPPLLNCVSGDTLIHIKGGAKPARELAGRVVEGLSEGGVYRKSKWESYGVQPLLRVHLENGDSILATPDHEWVAQMKGGADTLLVKTKNLKGRRIPFCHPITVEVNADEFKIGVRHGMVFGDGSLKYRKTMENYTEVRQFGEVNTKILFDWFETDSIRHYNDKRYGTVYYASYQPGHFKALPSKDQSVSYLRGFIAGMIASDGHISTCGGGMIFQKNLEDLRGIRDLASIAGLPSMGIRLYRYLSPFTGKPSPCHKLTFYKNIFKHNPMLVIKETHREHLNAAKKYNKQVWMKVSDVEYTCQKEEVYCCEEPETHTMVVGNGYLTRQCFVLKDDLDSKESWGDLLRENFITAANGGGCGQSFSSIRPEGAPINGTRGTSSGPVSLMHGINAVAKMVRAGGSRRAANMFSLDINHPDIEKFLDSKLVAGELDMANISLTVPNMTEFINAVKKDLKWELSWKGKYKKEISAKYLWDKIVKNAWEKSEPGLLNMELAESESNVYFTSKLSTSNPCFSYESNILTSVGYKPIGSIVGENTLINEVGNKVPATIWSSGFKKVIRVEFTKGKSIVCTPDHVFKCVQGVEVKAKDLMGNSCLSLRPGTEARVVTAITELPEKVEVFDFNLQSEPHWGVVEGVIVSNCGEIIMTSGGSSGGGEACCLGSLVLPRFIKDKTIDWPMLGEVIRTGIRFLDNVLSINSYPLPQMKEICNKYRRVGLGTTGLADMLLILGFEYGSSDANKFLDKMYRFISKQAYETSVFLAAEKGMFSACTPDKLVESGYMKRMTNKIRSMVLEHGIRNCALLTQPPCGTISILSGNCSSGIEPIFAPAYYRNFYKDGDRKRELCFHPLFSKAMQHEEAVDHFLPSTSLKVEQHLEVQKVLQRHVDNAISKTCILPKDYPVEDLSKVWLKYLPHLKGTTFYREGSRNFVDEQGVEHEPPLVAIPLKEAIKLYKAQKSKIKEEAAYVNDCPSGKCTI